jgi:hypothetical protein
MRRFRREAIGPLCSSCSPISRRCGSIRRSSTRSPRPTRSLADFASVVEILDARGVSHLAPIEAPTAFAAAPTASARISVVADAGELLIRVKAAAVNYVTAAFFLRRQLVTAHCLAARRQSRIWWVCLFGCFGGRFTMESFPYGVDCVIAFPIK